ncbi:MAG: hypothetical protein OXC18_07725 [Desulfurellaceae bacterium]|nr:hypothetical protein [Desulfurellaceae bacterium]
MDEISTLPPEEQLEFERGRHATYVLCIRNVMKLGLTEEQIGTLLKPDWTTIRPVTEEYNPLRSEGERIGKQQIEELMKGKARLSEEKE